MSTEYFLQDDSRERTPVQQGPAAGGNSEALVPAHPHAGCHGLRSITGMLNRPKCCKVSAGPAACILRWKHLSQEAGERFPGAS